jgi:hypothetical protein
MSDLAQTLLQSFDARSIGAIAQQIGVSPRQAGGAIQAALPILLGQMEQNASTPQGAQALLGAVQRDHSAPGLDLGGLLGGILGGLGGGASQSRGGGLEDGLAILGHVFGGSKQSAPQTPQVPGLDGATSAKLLALLAPLVLAALGKMNQQGGGLNLGSLGQILGGATRSIGSATQQQSSASGGLLGAILDRDGDGDVDLGDLLGAAQSLGLFGKR